MSFVLQEFVHFVLPTILKGYGGSNAQQPIILVQPKTQFHIFGASVSNVTLVIIGSALVLARLTYLFVHRTKFGRGIRAVAQDPHHQRRSWGFLRERIIMTTFLIEGHARRRSSAALHPAGTPGHHLLRWLPAGHQGVLGSCARRHRKPARGTARRTDPRRHGELRSGTIRHSSGATSSPSVLLVLVLLVRPTGILGESLGRPGHDAPQRTLVPGSNLLALPVTDCAGGGRGSVGSRNGASA